jgi:hypothetical protein
MNRTITIKAAVIAAVTACVCLASGCNRNTTGASNAASDTTAASAPAAVSFPATAASDAPGGASQ